MIKKTTDQNKMDALIDGLLNKKDSKGGSLIRKFNRAWIFEVLNGEILHDIEQKFKEADVKGFDIVDFVKILLGTLEHSQEETIFIILEIIEFFKSVCESQNLSDLIRFKDFTNYIVEVMGNCK